MGQSPIFEVLWGTKERGLSPHLGKIGRRGAEVTREGEGPQDSWRWAFGRGDRKH